MGIEPSPAAAPASGGIAQYRRLPSLARRARAPTGYPPTLKKSASHPLGSMVPTIARSVANRHPREPTRQTRQDGAETARPELDRGCTRRDRLTRAAGANSAGQRSDRVQSKQSTRSTAV